VIAYKIHGQTKPDLDVWGPPERLSAVTLEGAPVMHGTFLYGSAESVLTSGIYEVTRGKFKVIYPFHEHATVLEGEVILSDEEGNSVQYGPGDSWFCHQGEVITWDVRTERLRKAFFVVTVDPSVSIKRPAIEPSGFLAVS
jgi:uncharacterized cupin superfamily protein